MHVLFFLLRQIYTDDQSRGWTRDFRLALALASKAGKEGAARCAVAEWGNWEELGSLLEGLLGV